jgi:hypothetical protein
MGNNEPHGPAWLAPHQCAYHLLVAPQHLGQTLQKLAKRQQTPCYSLIPLYSTAHSQALCSDSVQVTCMVERVTLLSEFGCDLGLVDCLDFVAGALKGLEEIWKNYRVRGFPITPKMLGRNSLGVVKMWFH